MRRYTSELIKEMREAVAISEKLKKRLSNDEIPPFFMGKNAYLFRSKNFGNPLKLEDIIGIPTEVLPPDNLLTNNEKAQLSRLMEQLMNIWNFYPEFPDELPDSVKYKHLKKVWESEQVYLGMGVNKIQFCDYDKTNCPFPGYCSFCDQIDEQEKLYNKLTRNTNNSNKETGSTS
ncbi:MAG: hypothetical protein ACLFNL_07945 [Bacteroidales bacterium]